MDFNKLKQRVETLWQEVQKIEQESGGDDSYTKAESDEKFLSKTDASTTYLSKTDAASTYVEPTDYATQTTGGTVKVWTTTSEDVITLHIATE